MGRLTRRRRATRIVDGSASTRVETLAVEEPLEIRLGEAPFTLTMRSPGHDVELAHGLLRAEGVIASADDVAVARFCTETDLNVLEVHLRPGVTAPPVSATRSLAAYGGCGLCGSSTVAAVADRPRPQAPPPARSRLDPEVVTRAAEQLRRDQRVFASTGGVHGAAAADVDGTLLVVREDIGRHNAVDKVLGHLLMQAAPPPPLLLVSSRASFEIVAKAAMSGVPVLACVSAPSSLAVDAADELGITLLAFVREDRLTVYTHPERILGAVG